MKLGTWLCNDGRTKRPRRCTWMRAVAITAVAFVFLAAVFGEQPCPSLPVSCPAPLASPLMCNVRSPGRSTYPDLALPELCQLDFRLNPPLQMVVFCQLDYQEVNDSTSQLPRVRLVLLLVLKLSNM